MAKLYSTTASYEAILLEVLGVCPAVPKTFFCMPYTRKPVYSGTCFWKHFFATCIFGLIFFVSCYSH